jgi:hypothetical protein
MLRLIPTENNPFGAWLRHTVRKNQTGRKSTVFRPRFPAVLCFFALDFVLKIAVASK